MVDLPAPLGPTMAMRLARLHDEAHILQDRPARIIAEGDMAEFDPPAGHQKIGRARAIGDLDIDPQQIDHGFHVDQGLADLAIDRAEEIERQIELDQIGVHHHEIAHRRLMRHHRERRHGHQHRDAEGDDDVLADVEPGKADAGLDRRRLVALQREVVAPRLMRLIAEIFDRLVVQQAVDGLGIGLLVRFVHLPAMGDAPFGERQGEPDIAARW